jgi:hypothetical protein
VNRDPIQERGGFNLYEFCLNNPILGVDLFGFGTWKVQPGSVTPGTQGVRSDASASGFFVTYTPDSGECSEGKIVVYTTISLTGAWFQNFSSHVDCRPEQAGDIYFHHPKTGCALPPAMLPKIIAPGAPLGSLGYYDSPYDGGNGGTFRITAVASCRNKCKETKVLSTYYFEWDEKSGSLDLNVDHNYQGDWQKGLKCWNKDPN